MSTSRQSIRLVRPNSSEIAELRGEKCSVSGGDSFVGPWMSGVLEFGQDEIGKVRIAWQPDTVVVKLIP